MSKWVIRFVGVVMILMFLMVMTMLYRQLVAMQRAQQGEPAASTRP